MDSSVKVDSSVPYIQRLYISTPIFSDSVGSILESFSSNAQIQIVGSVINNHDLKQKFVYLFQVKNDDESVESISWIQGDLLTHQDLNVSQLWTLKKPGVYVIESFVCNSIDNPIALYPMTSVLITVK